MRWRGRRESENVEDRRSWKKGGLAVGGVGGILLLLLVVFLGGDPAAVLGPGGNGPPGPGEKRPLDPAEEEAVRFVKVVLADTEDVWNDLFRREGKEYREPKLVLFRDGVRSACGFAGSAVGPFYCPGDSQVYLDLSFFEELHRRFGAPGDFAQAYVIAHEVGHHVQNLLGTSDRVEVERRRASEVEGNRLSVRLELQADYLAGVWAHHIQKKKKILDPGDIEEALNAANAIGDDRLQKKARGRVVPDSFTHGTSAQRIRWFRRGFETGDFSGRDLLFQLDYDDL
ncbi:MAG TPA: neutral zinc metallopeptidase [Gemmataceae bacterium]